MADFRGLHQQSLGFDEMSSHNWRKPVQLEEEKGENEIWPELRTEKLLKYKYDVDNPRYPEPKLVSSNAENKSAHQDQLRVFNTISDHLSQFDYPELEGMISKRKGDPKKDLYITTIPKQRLKIERDGRRSRRTKLIRIELEQLLKAQNVSKNKQVNEKTKNCNWMLGQTRMNVLLTKRKRYSKLKRIILNEKEKRKGTSLYDDGCLPIDDEIAEINLNKLKIIPDPELDVNYVRKFAALNILGGVQRESKVEFTIDDILENRIDVTRKLENLSISKNQENEDVDIVNEDLRFDVGNLQIDGSRPNNSRVNLADVERFQGNCHELKYSRKFQEYCTNIVSPVLNEKLEDFLAELVRLQKKLYERNNVRGRFKRRFFTGFKEVEKYVKVKKIKLVIIAPDIERIQVEGGLYHTVEKLISSCREQDIPICFGLSRRKFGYLTHKKGFVSCIGVSNFSAIEEKLEVVLLNLIEAKNEFRVLKNRPEKTLNLKELIDENLLIFKRINVLLRILASSTLNE